MAARPGAPEPRLDVLQGFSPDLDARFRASQWCPPPPLLRFSLRISLLFFLSLSLPPPSASAAPSGAHETESSLNPRSNGHTVGRAVGEKVGEGAGAVVRCSRWCTRGAQRERSGTLCGRGGGALKLRFASEAGPPCTLRLQVPGHAGGVGGVDRAARGVLPARALPAADRASLRVRRLHAAPLDSPRGPSAPQPAEALLPRRAATDRTVMNAVWLGRFPGRTRAAPAPRPGSSRVALSSAHPPPPPPPPSYQVDTPRPSPHTNRTRRVPHPVLIGHAASAP